MIGDALSRDGKASVFDDFLSRYTPAETFDIPLPQGELLRFRPVTNNQELEDIKRDATKWAQRIKDGADGNFLEFRDLHLQTLAVAYFLQRTMVGYWSKTKVREVEGSDDAIEPDGVQEPPFSLLKFCLIALKVAFLFEHIRIRADVNQVNAVRAPFAQQVADEKKE